LDRQVIRRRFEERFTAARMAKDYLRVYRSVIGANVKLTPDQAAPLQATVAEFVNEPSESVHWWSRRHEWQSIPPDRRLQITNHELAAAEFDKPRGQRTAIDLSFRSLAERTGDGFAVILTGAGSDGAIGVRAIKEAGGIVLVQDPDEAEHASMPRSAIATGVADSRSTNPPMRRLNAATWSGAAIRFSCSNPAAS
jgi:CheB methylesterase